MSAPAGASLQRLLDKVLVDPTSGCWNWQGAKSAGYGHVRIDGRLFTAHRAAYTMLRADIPEGLELDHLCKNPACVNPDHLEPVTHRENSLRSDSPTAIHARATSCIRGHPFDEENTHLSVFPGGRVERHCRACTRRRVFCPECGTDLNYTALSRHRRRRHAASGGPQ